MKIPKILIFANVFFFLVVFVWLILLSRQADELSARTVKILDSCGRPVITLGGDGDYGSHIELGGYSDKGEYRPRFQLMCRYDEGGNPLMALYSPVPRHHIVFDFGPLSPSVRISNFQREAFLTAYTDEVIAKVSLEAIQLMKSLGEQD